MDAKQNQPVTTPNEADKKEVTPTTEQASATETPAAETPAA
jgi:hypothetical protein